jgi:hypothetical protein
LSEKVSFFKADDEFDEVKDIGKNMEKTIKLNEIAYTELILSIDDKASYSKIALYVIKSFNSRNFLMGN